MDLLLIIQHMFSEFHDLLKSTLIFYKLSYLTRSQNHGEYYALDCKILDRCSLKADEHRIKGNEGLKFEFFVHWQDDE